MPRDAASPCPIMNWFSGRRTASISFTFTATTSTFPASLPSNADCDDSARHGWAARSQTPPPGLSRGTPGLISNDQRSPVPWANCREPSITVCPAGCIPSGPIPEIISCSLGGSLLRSAWIGAIEIARRSGRKLKVAAKVDAEDRAYYQSAIEPLMRESQSFRRICGRGGRKG